jgi:two-component system cell cycle sensor histidine kinase/response regulator CckA
VNAQLFQSVIEAMKDMVALQNAGGRLVYVNPSASHLLGFTPEDLLDTPGENLIHPDDRCLFEPSQAESAPETRSVEVRCRMSNGGYRRLRVCRGVVRETDGSSFSFFRLSAIEADREPEEQRGDKSDSLRRLAGGVAHEFNNLLTVITGYTHVLLEEHGADESAYESLSQIRKAAERAAELVRQLLAVGGQQMLQPIVININTIVQELSAALQRLLGPANQLDLRLDPTLPAIKIDPTAIGQVLFFLAANARDAMQEGGKFTVTTTPAPLESPPPSGSMPDPAVQLTVSDTGCGMDERTLHCLFEPFFTTKEVGQGTGLSLAAAYGAVRQCGGRLSVSSQLGQGTTFTIVLPSAPPRRQ